MDDTTNFFKETQEGFTIYVVELKFACGRGNEYFKQYRGKNNFISSRKKLQERIEKIIFWLGKGIPPVAALIKFCLTGKITADIHNLIEVIAKLSSLHEHQANGPEVIDPIIIQEGDVTQVDLAQIISLHRRSILTPVIIIILKDNDFERAKRLFVQCPNGINVKMIRNSGHSEIYKVVNRGATDVESFLDAFSRQCFSTCSRTPRQILLNEEWSHNDFVREITPLLFKIRTNLLLDFKNDTQDDLSILFRKLDKRKNSYGNDAYLFQCFDCIAKLSRVYCFDHGGQDIQDAYEYARNIQSEYNNDLLLAYVYRYAYFLNNFTVSEKIGILQEAHDIFSKHQIEDHAIYCQNNALLYQFYTETVRTRDFENLQEEAFYNVPGLVGMSIIYNNTAIASLYTGDPDNALELLDKALPYAKDRMIQKLGIKINILIAKDYSNREILEEELLNMMQLIFAHCGVDRLPFLAANFIVNVLSLTLKRHRQLYTKIIDIYPIIPVFIAALQPNQMGSGSLVSQMIVLQARYKEFVFSIPYPKQRTNLSGIRANFILTYGLNPTIFNAWL